MAEPWKCPECGTWNAPDVKEHRCDPGGGVPAKVATGGGGGSSHPSLSNVVYTSPAYLGGATITTSGTTYSLGSAA